jgi:hypothetical protein
LGGFGYVHGYTNQDVTEEGSPTGTACVVMSNSSPDSKFCRAHFHLSYRPSSTVEEMEKRAPLGGFGYVHGYTNEDVTEGSPTGMICVIMSSSFLTRRVSAASVEGRAPIGLAA